MGLKPATNPDVEAVAIELSIDGKSVAAKDGVSLYDVISSTGKIIPAMCYHYTSSDQPLRLGCPFQYGQWLRSFSRI